MGGIVAVTVTAETAQALTDAILATTGEHGRGPEEFELREELLRAFSGEAEIELAGPAGMPATEGLAGTVAEAVAPVTHGDQAVSTEGTLVAVPTLVALAGMAATAAGRGQVQTLPTTASPEKHPERAAASMLTVEAAVPVTPLSTSTGGVASGTPVASKATVQADDDDVIILEAPPAKMLKRSSVRESMEGVEESTKPSASKAEGEER